MPHGHARDLPLMERIKEEGNCVILYELFIVSF